MVIIAYFISIKTKLLVSLESNNKAREKFLEDEEKADIEENEIFKFSNEREKQEEERRKEEKKNSIF